MGRLVLASFRVDHLGLADQGLVAGRLVSVVGLQLLANPIVAQAYRLISLVYLDAATGDVLQKGLLCRFEVPSVAFYLPLQGLAKQFSRRSRGC